MNLRIIILFLANCSFLSSVICQENLIENGGFEIGDLPCDLPNIKDINLISNWSGVPFSGVNSTGFTWSGTSGGQYVRQECNPTYNGTSILAQSGKGHLRLGGSVYVNGMIRSNIIKAELNEPLEKGVTYYFEMYGRSLGIRHTEERLVRDCDINPERDLKIYISDDPDDFSLSYTYGKHLLVDAQYSEDYRIIPLFQDVVISSWETSWQKIEGCFVADGEERSIALAGPNRKSTGIFPCEIITDRDLDTLALDAFNTNRFFQFFDYEVDEVGLYEIPKKIEVEDTMCINQELIVDISLHLPDISFYKNGQYLWDDGREGPRQSVTEQRSFLIDVVLPCSVIPVELSIYSKECPSPFYMPNVFSPNNDGVNDYFQPIFNPFYIIEYVQFEIYDRWGNQVFLTNQLDAQWNGTFRGKKLKPGNYIWNLKYQHKGFASSENKNGILFLAK